MSRNMDVHDCMPASFNPRCAKDVQEFLDNLLIRANFSVKTRKALGWQGLGYTCYGGEGWTCRVDGCPGVFAIAPGETNVYINRSESIFNLYYFPEPDEPVLEHFSIKAELIARLEDYDTMVRDFPAFPDCLEPFHIGSVPLTFLHHTNALCLSLRSRHLLESVMPRELAEVLNPEGNDGSEKPMADQQLEAFDLAFRFFGVLAATFTYNLQEPPGWCRYMKPVDPALETTLSLGYGTGSFTTQVPVPCEAYAEQALKQEWRTGERNKRPFSDAPWWNTKPGTTRKDAGPDAASATRPDFIILTGFLGSGKTTFLRQLIEYHVRNNRFVAVIQNEIGEKGLDGSLLEDQFAVTEMDEGCICCTLIGQLRKGIEQILARHKPELIVLETTGLANPQNLLAEMEDLHDLVHLVSVTTLVDALNLEETLERSDLAGEQINAANVLLLNKTDRISESEQERLLERLHGRNPGARIRCCRHGEINPRELYDRLTPPGPGERGPNHTDEGMKAFTLHLDRALDAEHFFRQLEFMPACIYRLKGYVTFRGDDQTYFVQYVNGQFTCEQTGTPPAGGLFLICIGSATATASVYKHLFF